jgi:hypothetical protein
VSFNLNFASALEFPNHYIELTFYQLSVSAFSGYSVGDIIPCQLSDAFVSINNRVSPQCRLSASTLNYEIVVIIENFGAITVGTYWVSLDDFTLPSITAADNTEAFDIAIGFYQPSNNLKYFNTFQ